MFTKRLRETIRDLIKAHRPTHLLFAYDGHKNWRKAANSSYKGTRTCTDAARHAFALGLQWTFDTPEIHDIVKALNHTRRGKQATTYYTLPVIKHLLNDQLEADDVIHTAVHIQMSDDSTSHCVVIANDHDYLPLLKYANVQLINLQKKELELPSGVDASQMLTYKALLGDKSDNIPSAFTRCGKKTALKYIQQPDLLASHFQQDPTALERFEANLKLMDNTRIPTHLRDLLYTTLTPFLQIPPALATKATDNKI
jgi:5'-3' exonuclease